MRPNQRGSSTIGGKKSTVPMTARSGATRWTAASSGGSRPAIRPVEPSLPGVAPSIDRPSSMPSPESASARASAPSFAAQPPQVDLDADLEQQQDRADLGEQVDLGPVGDVAGGEWRDRDADREVTDDGRKARAAC